MRSICFYLWSFPYTRGYHTFSFWRAYSRLKKKITKQKPIKGKKKKQQTSYHGSVSKASETMRLAPWWGNVTHAGPGSAKHSSSSISPVHSSGPLSLGSHWTFCNSCRKNSSYCLPHNDAERNLIKDDVRGYQRKPSALCNNTFYWSRKTQELFC